MAETPESFTVEIEWHGELRQYEVTPPLTEDTLRRMFANWVKIEEVKDGK